MKSHLLDTMGIGNVPFENWSASQAAKRSIRRVDRYVARGGPEWFERIRKASGTEHHRSMLAAYYDYAKVAGVRYG